MRSLLRLLFVAAVTLGAAAPAPASERHPTLAELEREVMCPVCKEPLEMSDSAEAKRIEAYIRVRIAEGETKSAIKRDLVEEFGPGILAEPPRRGFGALAWLLPLVGGLVAVVAVGLAARHWRRVRAPVPEVTLDPDLDRRVDEALARFDG